MKRILVLYICVIFIMGLIVGCGETKPSTTDILNINGALVIGFSTPFTGEYTKTTVRPPESIADVEFMTYEAGGGIRYSPKSKVRYEKYKEIVASMIEIYGNPSKQKGYNYEWISSDDSFKVNMTYNENIYNYMAIGIN